MRGEIQKVLPSVDKFILDKECRNVNKKNYQNT